MDDQRKTKAQLVTELVEARKHVAELSQIAVRQTVRAGGPVQFQTQIIDRIHDSVISTDLDGIITS